MSQLNEVPALIAAIKVYEQGREENGEQIGQQQYLDFVAPGEHAEVAEQKEHCQSDDRQIERCKYHAHDASGQDDLLFSFHWIFEL